MLEELEPQARGRSKGRVQPLQSLPSLQITGDLSAGRPNRPSSQAHLCDPCRCPHADAGHGFKTSRRSWAPCQASSVPTSDLRMGGAQTVGYRGQALRMGLSPLQNSTSVLMARNPRARPPGHDEDAPWNTPAAWDCGHTAPQRG